MNKERFANISDEPNLVRDMKSNAILNTDMNSLQKYKMKREKDRETVRDIEKLKADVLEIKHLLQQLVNRD
jgi:hypothetical protein